MTVAKVPNVSYCCPVCLVEWWTHEDGYTCWSCGIEGTKGHIDALGLDGTRNGPTGARLPTETHWQDTARKET